MEHRDLVIASGNQEVIMFREELDNPLIARTLDRVARLSPNQQLIP
jgi:hypothetical protein